MSNYAKQQEYRVKKLLESLPGVAVVKYYGSRQKDKGDLLVKAGHEKSPLLRIDHKSTRNPEKIVVEKDWMPRLQRICNHNQFEEGKSLPVITLSLLNHRKVYAISYLQFGLFGYHVNATAANRVHIYTIDLDFACKAQCSALLSPDYPPMFLYRLEMFIERFRLNY